MHKTTADIGKLGDWIGYGRNTQEHKSKRTVRRWILEARGHVPVIDRVNYPDFDYNRRIGGRG